jgi:hypothetical protein
MVAEFIQRQDQHPLKSILKEPSSRQIDDRPNTEKGMNSTVPKIAALNLRDSIQIYSQDIRSLSKLLQQELFVETPVILNAENWIRD